MSLKFYNTATRTKEDFIPIDSNNVRMYVCGPTVYDFIHIGNARPIVVFDVLYRLLKTHYDKVTYVRNITDVDDKINARALEKGISIGELTTQTTQQFLNDADALGSLRPDVQPKATEYIENMVSMIEILIEKGHAYEAQGHVLFRTASWQDYGAFANKDRDEQIAGARVEVASYKEDPADFVLWKPSDDGEPAWQSPWSKGRPGWHIECSAMAKAHLGDSFDIHGGGLDLIFPHHQNEIAQSCCANGKDFAKYWMHNGFLNSEGEKMSKSLGNFYTVRELLDDGYHGECLRLVNLMTHYRQPLDFSKSKLSDSKKILDKFYKALHSVDDVKCKDGIVNTDVRNALGDDLNTHLAITKLFELLKQKSQMDAGDFKAQLLDGLYLLGIGQDTNWHTLKTTDIDGASVENLIMQRRDAKARKDYATADQIRDQLLDMGVTIKDMPNGETEWDVLS